MNLEARCARIGHPTITAVKSMVSPTMMDSEMSQKLVMALEELAVLVMVFVFALMLFSISVRCCRG